MEHTKELLSISLSNLVPSPYNVRRHSAGQVEELAALIGSQGLLHPLIVTEHVAGRGKARKDVEARMEVARPWRHKLTSPTAIHLRCNVSQLVNKELVMAATSMVHVRVDEHIKTQATETLAAMGLSVSDAVRVFLTRVVAEQQLPFSLKAPNADTRAAMAEARAISKARFASAKELIVDLEKGAKR